MKAVLLDSFLAVHIWKPNWPRPLTGLVRLSEIELGPGPYALEGLKEEA